MTATLKATNLAAGHGARALFAGLDLVIGSGDVIGLVGPTARASRRCCGCSQARSSPRRAQSP